MNKNQKIFKTILIVLGVVTVFLLGCLIRIPISLPIFGVVFGLAAGLVVGYCLGKDINLKFWEKNDKSKK